jgi:hypothetical protein
MRPTIHRFLFDVIAGLVCRYDISVSSSRIAVVFVALALGCELTSELGVYTSLGDETVADPDTDTESDSAEGGMSGGESETGEAGDGDGEPGDGDGEPGDGEPGDGDGEPGDGELCTIDGSEDPCGVCLEYLCCDFIENCHFDMGCNCMVDCMMRTEPVICAMTCAPGPAYFQLLQCQATSCGAVCG